MPGTNAYGLIPHQPVFTPGPLRFRGEQIAAVAAVDEDTAIEALEKIKLEIEEQPPVLDPWEIRFINAWRDGDQGATRFTVQAAGLIEAMKRAAELARVELPDRLMAMSSRGR